METIDEHMLRVALAWKVPTSADPDPEPIPTPPVIPKVEEPDVITLSSDEEEPAGEKDAGEEPIVHRIMATVLEGPKAFPPPGKTTGAVDTTVENTPTNFPIRPSSPLPSTSAGSSPRPGPSTSGTIMTQFPIPTEGHIPSGNDGRRPADIPSDLYFKVGHFSKDKVKYELFVAKGQHEVRYLQMKLDEAGELATRANQQLTDALNKTLSEKLDGFTEAATASNAKDIASLKEHVTKEMAGLRKSMIQNHKYVMLEMDLVKRRFEEGQDEMWEQLRKLDPERKVKGSSRAKNVYRKAETAGTSKRSYSKAKVSQVKVDKNPPRKRGRPIKRPQRYSPASSEDSTDDSEDESRDDIRRKQSTSRNERRSSPRSTSRVDYSQVKRRRRH